MVIQNGSYFVEVRILYINLINSCVMMIRITFLVVHKNQQKVNKKETTK